MASHELQTPLTTLRMTLLMLQETADLLPARERELVATSLIGVEQLSDTVHEFLDLTRIEAGQLRLYLEPVPVATLLADVIRRAQRQADAQVVHLHTDVEPGLPSVTGDQRRLQVVFDNIMSNALKYTPSGKDITIRGRRSGSSGGDDTVLISVTDTGPGVPSGFRARIFDKFFRLEHQQPDDRPHARGGSVCTCAGRSEFHGGRIEYGQTTRVERSRWAAVVHSRAAVSMNSGTRPLLRQRKAADPCDLLSADRAGCTLSLVLRAPCRDRRISSRFRMVFISAATVTATDGSQCGRNRA